MTMKGESLIERVCIANADPVHPVYHAIGRFEGLATTQTTRCGGAEVDRMFGINSIRLDHAKLFARPCGRCFPQDKPIYWPSEMQDYE
jgi:hypothetical protein